MTEDLGKVLERCWEELCAMYKLRRGQSPFLSEADVHHTLATLLEREKIGDVHIEFPLPMDPSRLWEQIEWFGRVGLGKGYYRADICVLEGATVRLIVEIRWMPAILLPIEFLENIIGTSTEQHKLARERLDKVRRRYAKAAPQWYRDKLLRNIDKFLDLLRKYGEEHEEVRGYLCILDELCPSIKEQVSNWLAKLNIPLPRNFHVLANYVE